MAPPPGLKKIESRGQDSEKTIFLKNVPGVMKHKITQK